MSGPSTKAVHAGERPDALYGAVNQAIVQSTTFRYPEREDGTRASHIYSRYDNPTLQAVEQKLAVLDDADGALVFASGLGAELAVFQAFLKPGDTIAVQEGAYGGTVALLTDELVPHGIRLHRFDLDGDPDASFPDGTRLVWMESITNPLLRVADLPVWAKAAHDAAARLCVDATFASPALQRPLEHGADLVMHSATKYLNGHADVTAGVVCFRDADRDTLWNRRRNLGATLDPTAAYLLGRGAKTLPLRMEAHCAHAAALADFAADHPAVTAVHYPGRADHPDHDVAARMLDGGFGGMLTLDLGSLDAAVAFRRTVRVITPAASLGGVESLVSLPLETSHAYASPDARAKEGVTDGLVRISVGVEGVEDLEEDLVRALDVAQDT